MFVFSVFLKYLSIVKDIAKIWIKSYTKQEKKEKISPIKKNILYFIEYKHIAKSEFCKKTGISYANLKGVGLGSEIGGTQLALIDRKSTRLNSSHQIISYAVFCLKKK